MINLKDIEELPDSVKAFLAFVIEDDHELSYELLDSELMKGSKLDSKCNEVLSKVGLNTDVFQGVGTQIEFERLMKAYYPNFKSKNFSFSKPNKVDIEKCLNAMSNKILNNSEEAIGLLMMKFGLPKEEAERYYHGYCGDKELSKKSNFSERLKKCFADNDSKWYVDFRDEDGEATESFNSKELAEAFIIHNEDRASNHAAEGEKFQLINGPYQK